MYFSQNAHDFIEIKLAKFQGNPVNPSRVILFVLGAHMNLKALKCTKNAITLRLSVPLRLWCYSHPVAVFSSSVIHISSGVCLIWPLYTDILSLLRLYFPAKPIRTSSVNNDTLWCVDNYDYTSNVNNADIPQNRSNILAFSTNKKLQNIFLGICWVVKSVDRVLGEKCPKLQYHICAFTQRCSFAQPLGMDKFTCYWSVKVLLYVKERLYFYMFFLFSPWYIIIYLFNRVCDRGMFHNWHWIWLTLWKTQKLQSVFVNRNLYMRREVFQSHR